MAGQLRSLVAVTVTRAVVLALAAATRQIEDERHDARRAGLHHRVRRTAAQAPAHANAHPRAS